MRVNFEDLGISLDLLDWAHQYVKEIQMHAARKEPTEPFPNLKISVTDTPIDDIHSDAETLIEKIKEGIPPNAKFSNLKKFNIGELKAISINISGQVHGGEKILIIMYLFSTSSKLINLSFTLIAETLAQFKDEFKEIVDSIEEI